MCAYWKRRKAPVEEHAIANNKHIINTVLLSPKVTCFFAVVAVEQFRAKTLEGKIKDTKISH